MPAEIKFKITTIEGKTLTPAPEILEAGNDRGFVYLQASDGMPDPVSGQIPEYRKVLVARCAENDKQTLIYDVYSDSLTVDGLIRAIDDKRNKNAKKISSLTDLRIGEPFKRSGKTEDGKADFLVEINQLSGQKRRKNYKKKTRKGVK